MRGIKILVLWGLLVGSGFGQVYHGAFPDSAIMVQDTTGVLRVAVIPDDLREALRKEDSLRVYQKITAQQDSVIATQDTALLNRDREIRIDNEIIRRYETQDTLYTQMLTAKEETIEYQQWVMLGEAAIILLLIIF